MPARLLQLFLRLTAIVCGLALVAVFMPRHWIDLIDRFIGLSPFPYAPIATYLARCLSAFYALYGGLMWLCSTDIPRYRTLILATALVQLVAAPLLLALDLSLSLPLSWTLSEAPTVLLSGLIQLLLILRTPAPPPHP